MVPETHELEFQTSEELSMFVRSHEFLLETAQKLRDQYEVDVSLGEPKSGMHGDKEIVVEKLLLSYTRNNAGGLKDAIDFLLLPFISRGLEASEIKGAIPRPKSDSFEDNMPFFESKLLQRAEAPLSTESPTRANFAEDGQQRSFFDKLRKPGSMSSFSSFLDRRRNGSNSPGSLFKHASSNASKASLVSMESLYSSMTPPAPVHQVLQLRPPAMPTLPPMVCPPQPGVLWVPLRLPMEAAPPLAPTPPPTPSLVPSKPNSPSAPTAMPRPLPSPLRSSRVLEWSTATANTPPASRRCLATSPLATTRAMALCPAPRHARRTPLRILLMRMLVQDTRPQLGLSVKDIRLPTVGGPVLFYACFICCVY